jgi:ATP-dependent DNA ligase
VRLFSRNRYNFADRFPRIVEAVASLPVQSCFIDGEAIVVDADVNTTHRRNFCPTDSQPTLAALFAPYSV